jgi:predicted metal-binding membrane protein
MRIAALRVGSRPGAGDGPLLALGVPAALLLLAVAGWWWSARMAGDMTRGGMDGAMSLGAFVLAWAAMMAAMMLPGVLPTVRLYARAAAKGRAAPVPFFVGGYLALWTAVAVPGYLAWRELEMPLAEGRAWAGRLAGATMLAAALWQITPLKSVCLRHCRSPLGFFLRFGGRIRRPAGALRMGAAHGAFCFGCCWALFAVLVALGTMNLLWMVLFTALIVLEKHAPRGEQIAVAGALTLAALGTALLADPSMLAHLT